MAAATVFGLAVKPGENPISAFDKTGFPCTVRITMAALDPTAEPVTDGMVNGDVPARATLKMLRIVGPEEDDMDEDDDDEDEDETLADLLNGNEDDDDEDDDEWDTDSDDEEVNGGPSDPKKSPKALKLKQFLREAKEAEEAETNGVKNKGKGKALVDEDSDSDAYDEEELDENVLCTLDPNSHYQQPLDMVISRHELDDVFFKVVGTHTVHLTGNILLPQDGEMERMLGYGSDDSEDDEDDYGMPSRMLYEDMEDDDEDEIDELDDLEDPRVMEVDSEDDAAPPRLVTVKKTTLSKKRPAQSSSDAEDEDEKITASVKPSTKVTADSLIEKSLKPADADSLPKVDGEQKLSKSQLKKQRKKLKDNQGKAVDVADSVMKDEDKGTKVDVAAATVTESKASPDKNGKGDKKVTFAKTLVQGPSGSSQASSKDDEASKAKPESKSQSAGTTRTVQGIKIFDKKTGTGPQAKKGDRLSMRYVGKLEADKRVFDSNTKGKPFSFKLGIGEVVKGMDIGVAGMSVGGERRITIPSNLAYGNKKQGDIPPNSTLIFELKLLSIH